MQKYSYSVKCDNCTSSVKWSGLPEPLDVDGALSALGWTALRGDSHRCPVCTARAAQWKDELDAVRLVDLDLDSIFGDDA